MSDTVIIKAKLGKSNFIDQKSLNENNNSKVVVYHNIGSIVSLNGRPYVLTCFHCLKNTYDQIIYYKNKSHYGHISHVSDELELGLMEIEGDIKSKTFDITNFDVNLNLEKKKLVIKTNDLNQFIEMGKWKSMILKCELDRILTDETCNITSINLPPLPYITMTLKKKYSDISELKGLSGSLLMSENQIIGIVTAIENSQIRVIPSITIMRFLNEIILKNSFNGICTFVGRFSQCDFDVTDNEKKYGIYIDDTFDINYNHYNYKDDQLHMNLRKNDIITKIENHEINKNGKIYDTHTGIDLNYRTFLALNFTCGESIHVNLMRCKKKENNDFKEKKIIIRGRPLNSMKYIPITFSGSIINYKGFIFIEMSEDIILNYYNIGINIGQSLSEYFLTNPYRNENERVVTLIDIDKNRINKKNLDIINELGLPLVNTVDKYYMVPILKKINKKKISNLKDLEKLLLLEEDKTLRFTINDRMKIKIIDRSNQNDDLEIKFTN